MAENGAAEAAKMEEPLEEEEEEELAVHRGLASPLPISLAVAACIW
jgi:hypothetical protein